MVPRVLDAVVVGSGPNGLSAAITLAKADRSVVVLEARDTPGGGCRTAELTLPGFRHDICSAIHPLALASPLFSSLDLRRHGLELIQPPVVVAHPLDDGRVASLRVGVDATAGGLGEDAAAWHALFGPAVSDAKSLTTDVLAPAHLPHHPLPLARFAANAVRSVAELSRNRFRGEAAPALLAGMAAHSMQPLTAPATAGFGMFLGVLGQSNGWPVARGGSQSITAALVAELKAHGGAVECDHEVRTFSDIPPCRAVFFDTTPAQMVAISGHRLPERFRSRMLSFPRGPGVFKIDYALSEPIPWLADDCRQAGTVHVGGSLEEITQSERALDSGIHPERPFCLVAQQSLFDPSRAPQSQHTGWVYCHVPNGSNRDMTRAIEDQMERFAPGFGDTVLARRTTTPRDLQAYNANYLGGDIGAGRQDLWHVLARPALRWSPYTTPNRHIFICSASTPPGGGVHGMCGYYAAQAALRRILSSGGGSRSGSS